MKRDDVGSIGAATPEAARQLLHRIDPDAYARTRNHLDGAVTHLSAYLTHGVIGLREVLRHLQHVHRLPSTHKLVLELGWREFFRHCWRHDGDAIFASLHPGPLADHAYATELPADIREARTGLAVVDQAVRELYATGYLHNHARLWLASYVVHLRKIHWRCGADWMYAHLLDGDLASNHLSWQWVTGTASAKPYLFNAENVRRYAPPGWQVDGSELETDYAQLERMARDATVRLKHAGSARNSCREPDVAGATAMTAGFTSPVLGLVADLDVWLVHPWSLRDPPADRLAVAVLDATFHRRWPWSGRRWEWITRRMQNLASIAWFADTNELLSALRCARSVAGVADPHLGALGAQLSLAPPEAIWPEPDRRQRSFSAWWASVQPRTPALA